VVPYSNTESWGWKVPEVALLTTPNRVAAARPPPARTDAPPMSNARTLNSHPLEGPAVKVPLGHAFEVMAVAHV